MTSTKKSQQALAPIPPFMLTLIIGTLMLASKTYLAFSSLSLPAISLPYTIIIAMLLMTMGCIPFANAVFLFITARTTINPTQPDTSSSLVTHGIYRFTRNPMYLGLLLWLMSWGIYLEDLVAISGPLFFYWHINRHQIPFEETALKDHFGTTYKMYCRKTRRWL